MDRPFTYKAYLTEFYVYNKLKLFGYSQTNRFSRIQIVSDVKRREQVKSAGPREGGQNLRGRSNDTPGYGFKFKISAYETDLLLRVAGVFNESNTTWESYYSLLCVYVYRTSGYMCVSKVMIEDLGAGKTHLPVFSY